jgi:hypothetical protein
VKVIVKSATVAALGVVTLSGCLGSGGSEKKGADQQPLQATPPAESLAPATTGGGTDGGSPGGALAKAGQSFTIGKTATLPYKSGSTSGTLAVTVNAIQKGSPADLKPLKLGDRAAGLVPYYIRVTLKNAGHTDLSFTSPRNMQGLLRDGSDAQGVSVIGTFAKCDDKSLPKGFTNGRSVHSCFLALASPSSAVTGAKWVTTPFDGLDNSVTWKS